MSEMVERVARALSELEYAIYAPGSDKHVFDRIDSVSRAVLREALTALVAACRAGREVVSPVGVGGMTIDACIDRRVIHGVRLRAVVDAEEALGALAAVRKEIES